jgi:hypothetical protein
LQNLNRIWTKVVMMMMTMVRWITLGKGSEYYVRLLAVLFSALWHQQFGCHRHQTAIILVLSKKIVVVWQVCDECLEQVCVIWPEKLLQSARNSVYVCFCFIETAHKSQPLIDAGTQASTSAFAEKPVVDTDRFTIFGLIDHFYYKSRNCFL